MARVMWDQTGERRYETGVDHGVLYLRDSGGLYSYGVAWNGLTAVNETPTGAESTPQYADNIKYLNLISAEEFGATIEAFTYPEEFGQCDGTAAPSAGVLVGQQTRKTFGLSYRTLVGNDVSGTDYGYKLHLIYGALASPSEKSYGTTNETPEAITFSWEVTTTPVEVTGFKPSAQLTVDSTKVDAAALASLENLLYGTPGTDPSLPMPDVVIALFDGTVAEVVPTEPTFDSGSNTITIPTVTGVTYRIDGLEVTGSVVIEEDTVVTATPNAGYKFPDVVDDDWFYEYI